MVEHKGPIARWARRNMPKREDFAESRWLKPLGSRVLHSEFWRFTRRSVPRGVGAGLLVGIFLMIPGLQIVGAALLCVPIRGNIPIAALMTFLSNPATTPFILLASLEVGSILGFRTDVASFNALRESGASLGEWFGWLFSDAAPAIVSGLFIIAAAAGLFGYLFTVLFWRWWQGKKWRRRVRRRGGAI
jgi:uncharacterized protein (DUF2062 family)